MNKLAAFIVGLSLVQPAAIAARERMQPGLWEVTATVELPGMASPPPTTQTECLSQADIDEERLPDIDQGTCRVTDTRRLGDKVTWKLDCGPIGKGEGEIISRSPMSYDGWMRLETNGMVIRSTIRARRLRDCEP